MVTAYEVQKLHQVMAKDLDSSLASIWKCAAGLLLVIALVAAGQWLNPLAGRSAELAQAQMASAGDDY